MAVLFLIFFRSDLSKMDQTEGSGQGLVSGGDRFGGVDGFFLAYPQSNLNNSYYSM